MNILGIFNKFYRQKNISKNIIFLGITQIINYIFPLLTLPFLVKTLGEAGFGKISFAQAFIGYFVLVVDYGFNISATRKISIFRNDVEKLRKIYYNTIYSKIILLLFSAVCLLCLTLMSERFSEDFLLHWFFFGMVVGNLLYPQWLFQGLEKMAYITIVNFIIKLIFTVLVFLLIRKTTDYVWVGLLTGVSYIIPGIYAFLISKKIVGKAIPIHFSGIKEEMKSGFHLFTSTAMTTVLTTSSIFILGLMSTPSIVGGYSAMDKLIKASLLIFAPITMAIYPSVSKQLVLSEKKGINKIIKYALPTIIFALFLAITLFIVRNTLIEKFYSPELLKFSSVFVILLFWIPISVLNNFIGIQYLTGSGRGKIYGQSFLISGLSTLVVMIILTKLYSYNGTALSVLFGELLLMITMLMQIFIRIKKK